MSKQITPGSFNDPRETSKLVGGQEGYAQAFAAWHDKLDGHIPGSLCYCGMRRPIPAN